MTPEETLAHQITFERFLKALEDQWRAIYPL